MSIRVLVSTVSAVAGIGSASLGVGAHVAAASTPAASTPAPSSTAPSCDDGRWHGPDGIDVQGRPVFDAGDGGAAYIWHGDAGWHLRTTDAQPGAHHYTGTITASPGAAFTAIRPVRNERDDHVWVSGDGVLHYDLTTYRGIDGFDFRVTACAHDRDHEALRFSLDDNGRDQDVARIKLGSDKRHPDSATFSVWRDA